MMSDEEFEALKEQCRQMRLRGLERHWSYELATHTYLFRKYQREKQRREVEAMDAAFKRAAIRLDEVFA